MAQQAQKKRGRRIAGWKLALFSLVPLLLILFLGEVLVRVKRGKLFSFTSTLEDHWKNRVKRDLHIHDPELGHVPNPGKISEHGPKTTISQEGMRVHESAAQETDKTILAVGDSFTFCAEVSDNETWPFYLEARLKTKVINAGVCGYGLGQSVLRAERLIPKYKPDITILSFIPDNVRRAELSVYAGPKPYFDIENGKLVLKNVPVPTIEGAIVNQRRWLKPLRYSHLADAVLGKIAPGFWGRDGNLPEMREHSKGPEVALLLVRRFIRFCKDNNTKPVLMVLGPSTSRRELLEPIFEAAKAKEFELIDMGQAVIDLKKKDPKIEEKYFTHHMTAAGNEWVAKELAKKIAPLLKSGD